MRFGCRTGAAAGRDAEVDAREGASSLRWQGGLGHVAREPRPGLHDEKAFKMPFNVMFHAFSCYFELSHRCSVSFFDGF